LSRPELQLRTCHSELRSRGSRRPSRSEDACRTGVCARRPSARACNLSFVASRYDGVVGTVTVFAAAPS
jgi:hypothetical protein